MADRPASRLPRIPSIRSFAIRTLISLLRPLCPGERIAYAALSDAVGFDVQRYRSALDRARKVVRELEAKEFDVELGVGLVCLREGEKVAYMGSKRRLIQNRARTIVTIGKYVDMAALTPIEQGRAHAEITIAAAVSLATHERTVETIEATGSPRLAIDTADYQTLFRGL